MRILGSLSKLRFVVIYDFVSGGLRSAVAFCFHEDTEAVFS